MIHSNTEKFNTVQRSNETTANRAGEISTALGDTIPVVDVTGSNDKTGSDELSSEEWIPVSQRNKNRRSGGIPPGQTGLVVTGVELGTEGIQIAHYFANKEDVDICNCELLTKRDDATFLTFKISVKNNDAGKLKDLAVLPEGWRIRPYNPPSAKKATTQRKQVTPVNQTRTASNVQPTRAYDNATAPRVNRTSNRTQSLRTHNMGHWNGMQQGINVQNISPVTSTDDLNMNVWNGADPLPENVNGMYGPQYANALMGGNIASGISAGGFNNSAVRNIPPGKPRKSNVGIAMQRANSQTVVNVPSDFSQGHSNSRSVSMGDDVH